MVASAHIENYAMKLFLAADKQDRASNFGKNVVKMFYSAGVLFDILETFGDLPPEAGHYRKYAKMKAAYIHNCLKNGETPVAGPLVEEEDQTVDEEGVSLPVPSVPPSNTADLPADQPPAAPLPAPRHHQPYPPPAAPAAYPPAPVDMTPSAGPAM